jgi:hypothetical protein
VRLNTTTQCGSCTSPCALPNAATSCITGTCEVTFCVAPYANCDGLKGNGCEVNTQDSVLHCGACFNACSTNHGSPSCSNGSCSITCDAGYGNCNASSGDGCETSTTNDVQNCGGCGIVCAVQHGQPGCNGTTCTVASCAAPFANCDGSYANGCETNTSDNESHCGACNSPCNLPNAVSSCTSSACVIDACLGSYEDCDGLAATGCEDTVCPP